MKLTTLYRPVGPEELVLIEQSGWKRFPPRRPDQPIFYPVMNEAYAIQISVEWNVPAYGAGYFSKESAAKKLQHDEAASLKRRLLIS